MYTKYTMNKSKMVRVEDSTKLVLESIGTKSESFNDIIKRLINLYQEKINKRKTKINNFYRWAKTHNFTSRYWIYCQKCQKKRALELHHKDKNTKNNVLENIEFVCNFCHNKIHKGKKNYENFKHRR